MRRWRPCEGPVVAPATHVRLATQLGSSLTGVSYILDEPRIGLHPRDCTRLLETLSEIRDEGNTVIVVEHDEETIRSADHVIDMGPGAGARGGWIVAEGTPADLQNHEKSLTGKFLKGTLNIPLPPKRRKPADVIEIRGATEFSLKDINVSIPLRAFTCVTGVSGSGKSTLIIVILYKALLKSIHGGRLTPGSHASLTGAEKVSNVICVDQSPLGRTPRSNPATYTGVFTQSGSFLPRRRNRR